MIQLLRTLMPENSEKKLKPIAIKPGKSPEERLLRKHHNKLEWNVMQREKLKKIYEEGWASLLAIANMFGVSINTLHRQINKMVESGELSRKGRERLRPSAGPTSEQLNQIVDSLKQGEASLDSLAKRFQVKRDTLLTRLSWLGINARIPFLWSEKDAQVIQEGLATGRTDEELAQELGRPVWQVKRHKFLSYKDKFFSPKEKVLYQRWITEEDYVPLVLYLREEVKMTFQEIIETFGVSTSPQAILSALKNYHKREGEKVRLPLTPTKKAEIIRLSAEGKSAKEIAKAIERSESSVYKFLQSQKKGSE